MGGGWWRDLAWHAHGSQAGAAAGEPAQNWREVGDDPDGWGPPGRERAAFFRTRERAAEKEIGAGLGRLAIGPIEMGLHERGRVEPGQEREKKGRESWAHMPVWAERKEKRWRGFRI